jgi:hypothetical protein
MTNIAPQIPPAPRAVTPVGARRAWAEAGVRLWWMSALAIGALMLYLITSELIGELRQRALLRSGIAVTATIEEIAGRTRHQQTRVNPVPVRLRYALEDGREFRDSVEHVLEPTNDGSVIHAHDPLPIRVDPSDPTRWTEDRAPGSLLASMGIGVGLLPLVVLLMALALVRRQGVLRVWRDGELSEATVLSQRSSALAPGSQQLGISLASDPSHRVVALLHPRRAGIVNDGDKLHVIAPAGKPHKAIEAALYTDAVASLEG